MNNKINVTTRLNKDTIEQSLECGIYSGRPTFGWDHVVKEIMYLKEQGIREALIKLGWIPPEGE